MRSAHDNSNLGELRNRSRINCENQFPSLRAKCWSVRVFSAPGTGVPCKHPVPALDETQMASGCIQSSELWELNHIKEKMPVCS